MMISSCPSSMHSCACQLAMGGILSWLHSIVFDHLYCSVLSARRVVPHWHRTDTAPWSSTAKTDLHTSTTACSKSTWWHHHYCNDDDVIMHCSCTHLQLSPTRVNMWLSNWLGHVSVLSVARPILGLTSKWGLGMRLQVVQSTLFTSDYSIIK